MELGFFGRGCGYLSCTERVNDLLLAAADMCIPTFTVKKKINLHGSPGIFSVGSTRKKGYRENLRLVHQKRLSRKFWELRRSVKQLLRSEYKRYLQHLSSQFKNPKRFWSYHSIKPKSKRLPAVNTYNRRSATNPQEQAHIQYSLSLIFL